jgi:hypothetical protein
MVQEFKLNLNFESQLSKSGRPLRLSAISLVTTEPAIYDIDLKMYTHGTVYTFIYTDTDTPVSFKFDNKGKFNCKI